MMYKYPLVMLLISTLILPGALRADTKIPMDQVPSVVLDAARGRIAGLVPRQAYIETENGSTVYELVGDHDGEEYEIEVSANGQVLEVESYSTGSAEEEDDDDDNDDDDD